MKKLIIPFILLFLIACTSQPDSDQKQRGHRNDKPKNIILLIGDGMGVAQIYAAMSASDESLNIERFKNIGFHKTYCADRDVTDSGAGGTAMSSGIKTNYNSVGVDSLAKPVNSIIYYAHQSGLSTGLASTSSIVHATPASFYAHNVDRYDYENIAKDFIASDIDIIIGGGIKYLNARTDSLDLIDSLMVKDYSVFYSIDSVEVTKNDKIAVLTHEKHPPRMLDGRGDMLPKATKLAIDKLSKDRDGFFLMVEGSQIDWGGHDMEYDYVVTETIDFDKTVGVALDYAIKDKNTLVIVTADHETGGLSLPKDYETKTMTWDFGTDDHTGVMVPVFAFGPGAEQFQGIYENTDIFHKMMELLDLK